MVVAIVLVADAAGGSTRIDERRRAAEHKGSTDNALRRAAARVCGDFGGEIIARGAAKPYPPSADQVLDIFCKAEENQDLGQMGNS